MNLLKTLQPITFHRVFVDVTGSINAALMLSQALYWTNHIKPDRNGWFYKTKEEWQAETGLSRHEQDKARERLINLKLLKTRRAKVFSDAAITATWFQIDLDALQSALDASDQKPDSGNHQKPVCSDQKPESGFPTPYYPSNTNTTTTTARDSANPSTVVDEQHTTPSKPAHVERASQNFPHPIPSDWQPQPETLQTLSNEGMTTEFINHVREEFVLFWLIKGDAKPHWDAAFLRQCRCEHAYHQTQKARRDERNQRHAIRKNPARQPQNPAGRERKPTANERDERYRQFIERGTTSESVREGVRNAIFGEFVRH